MATWAEQAAELLELVEDLVDPDPCTYDHHGYCQAHLWLTTERVCPHKRAQQLLEARRATVPEALRCTCGAVWPEPHRAPLGVAGGHGVSG